MEFIGAIHSLANCTNVPQTAKSLRPPHTIHPIAELLLHRLHRSGGERDDDIVTWQETGLMDCNSPSHHHLNRHQASSSSRLSFLPTHTWVEEHYGKVLWIIRFYSAFCSYSVVCGQWRWLNETFCTSPRDWGLIPKSCPAKVRSLLCSRFN